jgi:hypothetical protein
VADCLWLCGREADSDEDIVSRWLRPHLRTSRRSQWQFKNIPGKHPVELLVPNKITPGMAVKASKIVCTRCNNTWMSQQEGKVRDPLAQMVKGKTVRLGPTDRASLGTWAAMKGILLENADKPGVGAPVVDEAVRRFFGANFAPPANTNVYAARIEPMEYATGVYTGGVRSMQDRVTKVYLAVLTLRSVGLVSVVGAIYNGDRAVFDQQKGRLLQMWPSRELTWENWPPPGDPFSIEALVDLAESPWRT